MILLDEIDSSLKDLKKRSLIRKRVVVSGRKKNKIKINGRWLINFASNDYLGWIGRFDQRSPHSNPFGES